MTNESGDARLRRPEPTFDAGEASGVEGYRIGDYVINLACFELRHRGTRRPVQPRMFDVLVYLLARRHRVVGIDELRTSVWGGVHVGANSVAFAISGVRRALGDDGKAQATIMNVRGRGYRIVAPVEEARGGRFTAG